MRLCVAIIMVLLNACLYETAPNTDEKNPKSQVKTSQKCQAFHKAIEDWKYDEALALVKDEGLDVNCPNAQGDLPILRVNRGIDQKKAQTLFNAMVNHKSFNPNAEDASKKHSLFARQLTLDDIKLLVSKGADINKTDHRGQTVIYEMASAPSKSILPNIKYIIEHKNYHKSQASLDGALIIQPVLDVSEYLIQQGALVTFDKDNNNPLYSWLKWDSPAKKAQLIVEQAEKQGLDRKKFINSQLAITSGLNPLYNGDTALHNLVREYAKDYNKPKPWLGEENLELKALKEAITYLIHNGAHPDIKNKAGISARDLAKNTDLTF